jgi:hypothetical protein
VAYEGRKKIADDLTLDVASIDWIDGEKLHKGVRVSQELSVLT